MKKINTSFKEWEKYHKNSIKRVFKLRKKVVCWDCKKELKKDENTFFRCPECYCKKCFLKRNKEDMKEIGRAFKGYI